MRTIACRTSKQRRWQPSSHHITAAQMVSPEGTRDGKQEAHHLALSHCSPPPSPWRRLRMRKHRLLAPES